MKVFNEKGSKERLFEMFQRVNKISLTEAYEDYNTPDNDLPSNSFTKNWSPEEFEAAKQNYINSGINLDFSNLSSDELETMMSDYEASLHENIETEVSQTPHLDNFQDQIDGGLADNKMPKEFNKEQLIKGLKVEMEHTDNPLIALEIAMDHLSEDDTYYGNNDEDPDQMAMVNAREDMNEDLGDDDEYTDNIKESIKNDLSRIRFSNNTIPKKIIGRNYTYVIVNESLRFYNIADSESDNPQLNYIVRYQVPEEGILVELIVLVDIEIVYDLNGYKFNTTLMIDSDYITIEMNNKSINYNN